MNWRMGTIRKIALSALLTAAAIVLILTVVQIWNYRQWDYLPMHGSYVSELDQRSRILQDRVEILSKRVSDMELLVLILLGTSGLYAIVFVASSYFSALSFARQADRSIAGLKDQIGLALGDMRELKEEAERSVRAESRAATPPVSLDKLRDEARALIRQEMLQSAPMQENMTSQVRTMAARIAIWRPGKLDEQALIELLQMESAVAVMELLGGPQLTPALAALYRHFARLHASGDRARTQFYLNRSLKLLPADSTLAPTLRYDLACSLAASHNYAAAIRELTEAFEHRSKVLDDRLAQDIEEGGELYRLAATPPYDKAVNDLLLNMSIGIG